MLYHIGSTELFAIQHTRPLQGAERKGWRSTPSAPAPSQCTDKTLKQQWEEYIGNEDPHKVTKFTKVTSGAEAGGIGVYIPQ